jgi:hypothetical protein
MMVPILRTDLDEKLQAYTDARKALTTQFNDMDKSGISGLNDSAVRAQAALFANDCDSLKKQVIANQAQILNYQKQLDNLQAPETASNIQDTFAILAGIPPAPPDITPSTATQADYWTSISIAVSSSYVADQSSSSSNSYSVGGSANWGLWSVGGGVSHSDSTSDAARQMANSSIKATFECMRVDITRGWMRPELFYDDDLTVASGNL